MGELINNTLCRGLLSKGPSFFFMASEMMGKALRPIAKPSSRKAKRYETGWLR